MIEEKYRIPVELIIFLMLLLVVSGTGQHSIVFDILFWATSLLLGAEVLVFMNPHISAATATQPGKGIALALLLTSIYALLIWLPSQKVISFLTGPLDQDWRIAWIIFLALFAKFVPSIWDAYSPTGLVGDRDRIQRGMDVFFMAMAGFLFLLYIIDPRSPAYLFIASLGIGIYNLPSEIIGLVSKSDTNWSAPLGMDWRLFVGTIAVLLAIIVPALRQVWVGGEDSVKGLKTIGITVAICCLLLYLRDSYTGWVNYAYAEQKADGNRKWFSSSSLPSITPSPEKEGPARKPAKTIKKSLWEKSESDWRDPRSSKWSIEGLNCPSGPYYSSIENGGIYVWRHKRGQVDVIFAGKKGNRGIIHGQMRSINRGSKVRSGSFHIFFFSRTHGGGSFVEDHTGRKRCISFRLSG